MCIHRMIQILYDWQDLASGVFALIASVAAIIYMQKQLSFEKKKHEEEKQANAFYTRSLMSDALSELIAYSKECFNYVSNHAKIPEKPSKAINILQKNIKHAPNQKTAENLFKVVAFYQVHNDRLKEYKKAQPINTDKSIYIDIVLLCCYLEALFPYARNKVQSISYIYPDERDVSNALISLVGGERYLSNFEEYEFIIIAIEAQRPLKD